MISPLDTIITSPIRQEAENYVSILFFFILKSLQNDKKNYT